MTAIQEYARELLRASGQTQLPICEECIVETLGVSALPYSQAKALLEALGHLAYANTVCGVSFYFEDKPYICYAAHLATIERRSVIMHECGHIYLKHVSGNVVFGKHTNSRTEDKQEKEADAFAIAVLAPVHLLRADDITCLEDIERICRISPNDAKHAHANLSKARRRKVKRLLLPSLAAIVAALVLASVWWVSTHAKQEVPPIEPPPTTQSEVQEPLKTQMVYISKSGSKYHRPDCYHIANSRAIPMSVAAAQGADYEACKSCRP